MESKSPGIAAVLSFFFPGIGFAYIGRPVLIAAGIGYFALSMAGSIVALKNMEFASLWMSLPASGLMALLSAESARMHNDALQVNVCPRCRLKVKTSDEFCSRCGFSVKPGQQSFAASAS